MDTLLQKDSLQDLTFKRKSAFLQVCHRERESESEQLPLEITKPKHPCAMQSHTSSAACNHIICSRLRSGDHVD